MSEDIRREVEQILIEWQSALFMRMLAYLAGMFVVILSFVWAASERWTKSDQRLHYIELRVIDIQAQQREMGPIIEDIRIQQAIEQDKSNESKR